MTNSPQRLEVKNWEHFVEIVHKFDLGPPQEPTFLFRGQADRLWSLEPSLVRLANSRSLLTDHVVKLEETILKEFKKQAHLYLSPKTIPETDDILSWWTLMQHHHAPTRLLDWTYSPFVALYFACIHLPKEDGAVWMVASRQISQKMVKAHPDCAGNATKVRQKQYYQSSSGPEFLDCFERTLRLPKW